ncbi:hypothetical protein BDN72DRAFT_778108 [Pluteus cervinus]|uniref:Uncharacterized protein n=1 Tax=Pluteus cervinus TaxID=181527 RepID=A0ACD3A776_9AGAR|nr:hypothetical protein BDN72DRAFT_778108 [Pluteus cervinus]
MNSLISPTPPPPSASPIQVQPQVQNQFQPQLQPQLQYQQHAPPQQQQQQQQQQPGQFYVTPEGYLLPVPRAPAVVQQQPQPTMGMSIQPGGGGNRNSKNLPYDAQGLREWSFEIFECCGDSETCLAALFCPCIVHSANEKRIQYLETHGTYDPEHGGPWCSDNCWDYICKTGVAIFCGCCSGGLACCCRMPCLMQISPRQHVRARYNIVGTASTDCVGAVCCSSCALTQESRELELEEMSLGWTKPTPTTQAQMQPSAPMQTQMVTVPPTATMTMVVPQSTGQAGIVGNEKYVVQV